MAALRAASSEAESIASGVAAETARLLRERTAALDETLAQLRAEDAALRERVAELAATAQAKRAEAEAGGARRRALVAEVEQLKQARANKSVGGRREGGAISLHRPFFWRAVACCRRCCGRAASRRHAGGRLRGVMCPAPPA